MHLSIEGDCTVIRAEEIRAKLLEVIVPGAVIELDLDKVTSLDFSFCQLIHSLRQTCTENGVDLKLSGNLPSEYASLANLCGLSEMTGGSPDASCANSEASR